MEDSLARSCLFARFDSRCFTSRARPWHGAGSTIVARTIVCGLVLIFALSIHSQTISDPVPAANPARPTVSTPATLTPEGYPQFETGSLGATTSPEFGTRIGINQVTKLTVLPRLEFFFQTEPYVHSSNSAGEDKQIHPREVWLGAQAMLLPADGVLPTISVSYVRRLYESPAPELDLGTNRQSGTLLLSNDVGGFHYDANFIVTEQTDGGVRRAQHAQTLSISHPLKKFTISGELWHFSQPFLKSNAVGNLWAVSYPLRRNLVDRWRVRPWSYQHLHTLGNLHRFYLSTSEATLGEMRLLVPRGHAKRLPRIGCRL